MNRKYKIPLLCLLFIIVSTLLPFAIFSMYDFHLFNQQHQLESIDSKIDSDIQDIHLIQSIYAIFNTQSLVVFDQEIFIFSENINQLATISKDAQDDFYLLENLLLTLLDTPTYTTINNFNIVHCKEFERNDIRYTEIEFQMENNNYTAVIDQHSSKIIYLEIEPLNTNIKDIKYFLETYISYLGLDIIDDWT